MEEWTMKYGHMTQETKFPGVWKLKEGGHLIRARAKDPRTTMLREVRRVLGEEPSAARAYKVLEEERQRIRAGAAEQQKAMPCFTKFFGAWVERRELRSRIQSLATKRVYRQVLKDHLHPAFGLMLLDQIRRADIEAWCDAMGRQIKAGELSPRTANMRLTLLKSVLGSAAADYDLKDPTAGVEPFSTAEHPTYTPEEPNSLTAEQVPAFLEACLRRWPSLWALACLGYATGLRPSSLRPLRKGGLTPDLVRNPDGTAWLYVRRSHTVRQEVMQTTKQKKHGQILLPASLVEVLDWHIAQGNEVQQRSELLFPSSKGLILSSSRFGELWPRIARAAGLGLRLTPRSMRRTFQDLCRKAEVKDLVTRSISGHASEAMQHHYSTVNAQEQAEAIAKVFDIMEARRALRGVTGGVKGPEAEAEDIYSDEEALAG